MTTTVVEQEVKEQEVKEAAEATPALTGVPQGPISPIPHSTSGAEILDQAAPVTPEQEAKKQSLLTRLSNAVATVIAMSLGAKAQRQAEVVGVLAELLPFEPTNKELAKAMNPTDLGAHAVPVMTVTKNATINTQEINSPKTHPNPYAQSVRRYKLLARVEANMPDENWDKIRLAEIRTVGMMINGVLYASPIAALQSGQVSMEAVFVAYSNYVTPRIVNMSDWSPDQIVQAKNDSSSLTVVVRRFDRKMQRDVKQRVSCHKSTGALFGTIMGLLEAAKAETKPEVVLGQAQAEQIIAAVNELVIPTAK